MERMGLARVVEGLKQALGHRVKEVTTSAPKVKMSRRCKWWNRGYCREQVNCLLRHEGEDCPEHINSGSCINRGCHRKLCKYWSLEEGCHRDLKCQFLHKDKSNTNQTKETKEKDKETKNKTVICFDKEVQTHSEEKYDEDCVCKTESNTNELFFKDRRIVCIFNRTLCTDEEWEIVEEQANESEMDLKESLEVFAKVLEGAGR